MKKLLSFLLLCSLFLTIGCEKSEPETETENSEQETKFNYSETTANTETEPIVNEPKYQNGEEIYLNSDWLFADFSLINSGCAVMFTASENRNGIIVAVNAGHGTEGGTSVKTYCHPDKTPKVTGGTTGEGAIQAVAVSTGMAFTDGMYERDVNLSLAELLRDRLLENGYDVLMIRNGQDVQLDNVARTVISNNIADCHIAIHFDGDDLDYDKGAFYIAVPDGIKYLDNVAAHWEDSENLGKALIDSLRNSGCPIRNSESSDIDLTQTAYSTIPTVDIEMGNQCTDHSQEMLSQMATALCDGVNDYYNNN